jgi:hypothetical protein
MPANHPKDDASDRELRAMRDKLVSYVVRLRKAAEFLAKLGADCQPLRAELVAQRRREFNRQFPDIDALLPGETAATR